MLAAVVSLSTPTLGFQAPAGLSRTAVRTAGPVMMEDASRREFFAKAGAALLAGAAALPASAKKGETGKQGLFSQTDMSSPFQPGGPASGPEATFGYKKSEGEFLAKGYELDVSREKGIFEESAKVISGLQGKVDTKTWWFVRDELRVCAYSMRSSMLAMNKVLPADQKPLAAKAYKKFWSEIEALDLACVKKELALAQKKYADVLAALEAYKKIAA